MPGFRRRGRQSSLIAALFIGIFTRDPLFHFFADMLPHRYLFITIFGTTNGARLEGAVRLLIATFANT